MQVFKVLEYSSLVHSIIQQQHRDGKIVRKKGKSAFTRWSIYWI